MSVSVAGPLAVSPLYAGPGDVVVWWDGGAWQEIVGSGAGIVVGDVAPVSPVVGQGWFDSVGGQLYVRVADGTSVQWVIAVNQPGPVGPAGVAGVAGPVGPMGPQGPAGVSASLPAGVANDQLVYVSGAWTNQRPRYVIGCFVPGVMTASQNLFFHKFTKGAAIPANFGSYLGHVSEAGAATAATASTAIDVARALSASPTSFSTVGTITFAAAAASATFASTGGTAISFAQGDVLRLRAPATPDATLANVFATVVGYET